MTSGYLVFQKFSVSVRKPSPKSSMWLLADSTTLNPAFIMASPTSVGVAKDG